MSKQFDEWVKFSKENPEDAFALEHRRLAEALDELVEKCEVLPNRPCPSMEEFFHRDNELLVNKVWQFVGGERND